MFFGFDFRDWLLANDPALSRLRVASRVTLTIALSFVVLVAIDQLLVPLPAASYGLGIVLSIEGGVAVRDKGGPQQLVTRLLGCAASIVVVGIASGLEAHRLASDFVFLLIIFLAASARVFGPRGHAIGMFSFTAYFMGAYFRPPLSELPLVAIGPVVSALIGQAARSLVLADDWRRDLLRSLESVRGRINQILFKIAALAAEGMVSERDRQELNQLEERLKEVVLMAESYIPRPPDGVLDAGNEPAGELVVRLFDAHLAADSAIMLCSHALPPFRLVHAIIEGEAISLPEANNDDPRTESSLALIRLGQAHGLLADTIAHGYATGFSEIAVVSEPSAGAAKLDFSLSNPLVRAALQITLASAIAMALGLALSRERWFWAVLASFLVFTNTNSRGDTAMKALQRSVGTLFGIAIGLVLATLLNGHMAAGLGLTAIAIFLAFYFLQTSYATMTFFVSISLCLVYGLIGSLTLDVLLLRVEETALGASVGTFVAFFVFPARTRGVLDSALGKWFGALEELLTAVTAGEEKYTLITLSQKLDEAYRNLAVAARPLGSAWSVVTRPGHIRQTLAIFLAATYWGRTVARNHDASVVDEDTQRLVAADLVQIASVSKRQSDCFSIDRESVGAPQRRLSLSGAGSRLGAEMIGATLDRLYPDA